MRREARVECPVGREATGTGDRQQAAGSRQQAAGNIFLPSPVAFFSFFLDPVSSIPSPCCLVPVAHFGFFPDPRPFISSPC